MLAPDTRFALRVIAFIFVVMVLGQMVALCSCGVAEADGTEIEVVEVPTEKPVAMATARPSTRPARVEAQPDPYAGWSTWCAPVVMPLCETAADCPGTEPGGKPWRCVQRRDGVRQCMGSWPTRSERERELERLRGYVDHVCGARCDERKLHALLGLVALRESTLRPWKRHRLNGDVRANREAWLRQATRYGHEHRRAKVKGKDRIAGVAFRKGGNPHYRERERWDTGLGLYGMNAAGWTAEWSADAPPEILCRDVEASEAYLRRTRRAWRKLRGGIDCDRDGRKEWHGTGGRPTWYDVHHAASGGKLCPSEASRRQFERRAKAAGLDPYEPITEAMLGTPIPKATQNEVAATIRRVLAAG